MERLPPVDDEQGASPIGVEAPGLLPDMSAARPLQQGVPGAVVAAGYLPPAGPATASISDEDEGAEYPRTDAPAIVDPRLDSAYDFPADLGIGASSREPLSGPEYVGDGPYDPVMPEVPGLPDEMPPRNTGDVAGQQAFAPPPVPDGVLPPLRIPTLDSPPLSSPPGNESDGAPEYLEAPPPLSQIPSAPRPDPRWLDAPRVSDASPGPAGALPSAAGPLDAATIDAAMLVPGAQAQGPAGHLPAWRRAAALAALSLEQEFSGELSPSAAPLDPSSRRMLAVMRTIAGEPAADLAGGPTDEPVAEALAAALVASLSEDSNPDDTTPAENGGARQETLARLREATALLAAKEPLALPRLAFCSQIDDFGQYEPVADAEFKSGQELLLYVELENFGSEAVAGGHELEFHGVYEIVDARGGRIEQRQFLPDRQVYRRPRRDYYIPYRLFVPKTIVPGDYTLRLTVDDVKGSRQGAAEIAFRVK